MDIVVPSAVTEGQQKNPPYNPQQKAKEERVIYSWKGRDHFKMKIFEGPTETLSVSVETESRLVYW